MGRLGQLPISMSDSVSFTKEGKIAMVKGTKGELKLKVPSYINVEVKEGELIVSKKSESQKAREMQGTIRAHLANMVKGVSEGWKKELEISGPGYRAEVVGGDLSIIAGFSHPMILKAPEGITFKVEKSIITVEGFDKEVVGQTAALIRATRKPNPYTGSGIKYIDEILRRKVGKQAAKAGE